MPRKYDSGETRRAAAHAAALLFLEKGYNHTTIRDICKKAGISTGSLFNVYKDKEAILYELVVYMFSNQMQGARALMGNGASPVMLYAAGTALQLSMAETSENIRDLYVTAYMLPTTSAYIRREAAKELSVFFRDCFPGNTLQDFYECEIGTGSMMRGYMSVPCDSTFTLEMKIRRFLEMSLSAYQVPPLERRGAAEAVLRIDLPFLARQVISSVTEWIRIGFPEKDQNLSLRISEFREIL